MTRLRDGGRGRTDLALLLPDFGNAAGYLVVSLALNREARL
jgi:hypothetical protein